MDRRKRSDLLIGVAVLVIIVVAVVQSSRLDGPIRAPIQLEIAVQELVGEGDREDEALLPLGDRPCAGTTVGELLICDDRVHLWTDMDTGASARPLFGVDGPVLAGGAMAPHRGILVYRTPDGLRYTTSHKTAKRVADQASEVWLYFGYEGVRAAE
jgi:hypothetical protein